MMNYFEQPLHCSLAKIDKLQLCDPEVKISGDVTGWNAKHLSSTEVCFSKLKILP